MDDPDFDDPIFKQPRSPEEFAAYIGTSLRYVQDEIRKGHLRARKHSAKIIRIWPAAMRGWVRQASRTA